MPLFRHLVVVVILASALLPRAGHALETVVVGNTNTATDIGLFIADRRGYFRQEGLDVRFVQFDSAARMVTSLAGGDLQVIAGAASAALYNAIARGVDVRIVADKVSTPPAARARRSSSARISSNPAATRRWRTCGA